MKPNASYKMSKSAKISLSINWQRPNQKSLRRSTAEAEMASKIILSRKREKDN
jgi:hypothetical protein